MQKHIVAALTIICGIFLSQAAFAAREYSETEQANLEVVAAAFEAFNAGDIETVLSMLTDDVVWYVNGDPNLVPHSGTWNGKAEVQEWAGILPATWEILDFGIDEMYVDGDTVFTLVHETDRSIATGKEYSQSEVMIFTLVDGKIAQLRSYEDTGREHWSLVPDEG